MVRSRFVLYRAFLLILKLRTKPMLAALERKLDRFAIPNLTLLLVLGHVATLLLSWSREGVAEGWMLVPERVWAGEVWRLLTFMFVPPKVGSLGLLGVALALYLLSVFGRALERIWGNFRYGCFIATAWFATVCMAFITPAEASTQAYILVAVFLAFSAFHRKHRLMLFFVLPVKAVWIAAVIWGYWLILLVDAIGRREFAQAGPILAATLTYLVFFGRELTLRAMGRWVQSPDTGPRSSPDRPVFARRAATGPEEVVHRCTTCGLTDVDDPDMQFRYCSQCAGKCGYCRLHLHDHDHR